MLRQGLCGGPANIYTVIAVCLRAGKKYRAFSAGGIQVVKNKFNIFSAA